jgi:hypothetical protein
MKKKSLLVFVLLLLVSLGGLAFGQSTALAPNALPENIKTIIKQNCSVSGCHKGKDPAAGLNLEPDKFLASVLNTPSQEVTTLKVVDPANPEKSYLLAKIKGAPEIVGKRMPYKRDPLTEDQIQQIERWLQGLAGTSAAVANSPATQGSPNGPHLEDSRETSAQAVEKKTRPVAAPAFWGTRLINLPTTTTLGKGEFLFRISHRFQPAVSSGWNHFFGLDGPAFILFSFGYGITDNLMLTIGRSKLYQEWDVSADWLLMEQSKKGPVPVSAALHVGGSLVTQNNPEGAQWSGRFRVNALLSLSYQVNNQLSVLLVPAYSSNTNFWEPSSEGTFALGIGGRFMLFNDISIIAEWVPALAGHRDTANSWGLGIDKKIGGHVFQFFVTNSLGITASQFLPGGDLKLFDGDFRIGFNIFRKF